MSGTGLLPEITHTIVEQYAAQVLDISSQYGADNSFSYAAANCLGVPTKFPKYGEQTEHCNLEYKIKLAVNGCVFSPLSSHYVLSYELLLSPLGCMIIADPT